MKTYTVKTQFIFKGNFYIKSDSKQQAKEFVLKHCGLVIGGDIHSSLPDDQVDWNFATHPEKKVS